MSVGKPCAICGVEAGLHGITIGHKWTEQLIDEGVWSAVYAQGDGTVGPNMSMFELKLRLDGLAKRAKDNRKRADDIRYDVGHTKLQSFYEGLATGLEVAMTLMGVIDEHE